MADAKSIICNAKPQIDCLNYAIGDQLIPSAILVRQSPIGIKVTEMEFLNLKQHNSPCNSNSIDLIMVWFSEVYNRCRFLVFCLQYTESFRQGGLRKIVFRNGRLVSVSER